MSHFKFYSAILIITMACSFGLIACSTTETSRTIQSPQVTAATATTKYTGVKTPISIGKFDNRSSYMRGVFSDNVDRLGGQAKTILETHLQQTGYFSVLNRDNLSEIKQEVGYSNTAQSIKGARYVITGDVSEFGRKEVGDQQLFGILGRGKQQVAYAKVNLNIVDVKTSEVVHSVQGAGEYALGAREVLGFGTTASYDSTLNGKVLDLAVREAVNNLVTDIQNNRWSIQ
ncbi:CsgG/HfaB family protein [Acinetobacter baumannii]|uniref:CsgG/HfaB family protein n=5 Tax=Acinetobacter TaxID=469 RepID=UPI002FE12316